jgi:succinoglycan biosynthesis transport protein ExoP
MRCLPKISRISSTPRQKKPHRLWFPPEPLVGLLELGNGPQATGARRVFGAAKRTLTPSTVASPSLFSTSDHPISDKTCGREKMSTMPDANSNRTEPESGLNDIIEGVLGILTRRRWWILTAACCITVAVVPVALRLPDKYVSQATLQVALPQVSQRYVQPDNSTSIPAVEAMKVEILSRTQLLKIIDDFGLYAKIKDPPGLLVERMLKDIDIELLGTTQGREDFSALTITFTAESPRLAKEVTSRLTSLFIERNLKTQGDQAANTTRFLSEQVDAAKQRLLEQEQRLQAFKTKNLGELPEQQATNLTALAGVEGQLQTTTTALLQAQQQRASIESSIESSLNERLARLQSEKTTLLTRFTSQYPAVTKKDKEIAQAQAMLDRFNSGSLKAGNTQDAASVDDPALAALIKQGEASAAAVERLSNEQKKLRTDSEQYQTRLNLTPIREQQLAEILRDDELLKKDYTELQRQKLQSQLTNSVEENQEGQQFRLVDPPNLPVKPSSPNRLKICLGGMGGGILFGIALGLLIDIRDGSFHNEKALRQSFALPIVMAVPLVPTPREHRARLWKRSFECVVGCAMTLAMFAAEFYVFRRG